MKTLKIKPEQLERAKNLYSFDELNNSITKGKGNIVGAIGEIVVHDFFKEDYFVNFTSTYNFDMIVDRFKVDVKSKKTTVTPKPYYLCYIPATSAHQKCDLYFFTRVKSNLEECYLLGFKDKETFFKESTFYKKGDVEAISGFVFKADTYALPISKLSSFKYSDEQN